MKIFKIIILILYSNLALGINNYKTGDTLYNWSRNGLILRDSNSLNGLKLQIIPYGAYVISNAYKPYRSEDEFEVTILEPHITIEPSSNNKIYNPAIKIQGQWLIVKFQNQEGYVYDGYLSHFPPPPKDFKLKYFDFFTQYFSKTFSILKETIYKDDSYVESTQEYGNGISANSIGFGGGVNKYFYIPKLSYDEVLLLLQYSGFIFGNDEYLKNNVVNCGKLCSRQIVLTFCCSLQKITLTEIGKLTIVEFVSAC